jgi:hypothetical protein
MQLACAGNIAFPDVRLPLQSSMWAQCGGTSSNYGKSGADPSMCCPLETACTKFTDAFWQCQPEGWVAPPAVPDKYKADCEASKRVCCLHLHLRLRLHWSYCRCCCWINLLQTRSFPKYAARWDSSFSCKCFMPVCRSMAAMCWVTLCKTV